MLPQGLGARPCVALWLLGLVRVFSQVGRLRAAGAAGDRHPENRLEGERTWARAAQKALTAVGIHTKADGVYADRAPPFHAFKGLDAPETTGRAKAKLKPARRGAALETVRQRQPEREGDDPANGTAARRHGRAPAYAQTRRGPSGAAGKGHDGRAGGRPHGHWRGGPARPSRFKTAIAAPNQHHQNALQVRRLATAKVARDFGYDCSGAPSGSRACIGGGCSNSRWTFRGPGAREASGGAGPRPVDHRVRQQRPPRSWSSQGLRFRHHLRDRPRDGPAGARRSRFFSTSVYVRRHPGTGSSSQIVRLRDIWRGGGTRTPQPDRA